MHEQAIGHFNRLLRLELDAVQRREIVYWIGDSYRGLEQYEQAALLYLQSAMMPGPGAMDPWAQTARYNAAESLKSAGLVDDGIAGEMTRDALHKALRRLDRQPSPKSATWRASLHRHRRFHP